MEDCFLDGQRAARGAGGATAGLSVGEAAARRLLEPPDKTEIVYVEGPQFYTPRDVANALSETLNIPVEVDTIPRSRWEETFRQLGFSDSAARTYTCMTGTLLDEVSEWPSAPVRGTTGLRDYVRGKLG